MKPLVETGSSMKNLAMDRNCPFPSFFSSLRRLARVLFGFARFALLAVLVFSRYQRRQPLTPLAFTGSGGQAKKHNWRTIRTTMPAA